MSVTDEKLLGLQQAKSNKLDKLYQTAGTNPELINDKSAEELQYDFGQALGHEVFTRDDGSQFQYALNPDGTYAHDETGNWIEQNYDNSGYAGNQRNLYVDNTIDGNYKFGLARSDTKDGITPFEARYRNNELLGNPYQGDTTKLYDGTPGVLGVTPEDGALLDVTLPYNVATNLENDVHSNRGQLLNRAIGQGAISEEDKLNYGSGKTEYVTPNAPLFNIDSQNDGVVSDDTFVPSVPETRNVDKEFFDQAVGNKEYLDNLTDAAQAGIGTFAAKTGDTIVDAVARGAKTVTDEETVNELVKDLDVFDDKGDFTGLDKYKLQTEYGYNPKNIEDASESIRKAYQEPTVGNVFNAILDSAVAGPEVLATSAGDVLAGVAGPAGWAVYAGNFTNEILEERAEAKGGIDNLTAEDRLIAVAGGVPAALINTLSKGNVALTDLKSGVQEALKKGTLSAVKAGVARGFKSATGEGLEEVAQEAITTVASKIATSNEKDLGSDKFWEDLAVSGGLGFAAGGTANVVGVAKDAVKSSGELIKDAVEPKAETPLEKEVEATTKVEQSTESKKSDELKNNILASAKAGDTQSLQSNYQAMLDFAKETGSENVKNIADNTFLQAVNSLATTAVSTSSPEVKTLGANKTDKQKEELVSTMIESLDFDTISEAQILNLAENFGLSKEKTKVAAEKGVTTNKLAKSISEVEGEVTEGAQGFKTYIRQFRRAGDDSVEKQKASDKIVNFLDTQEVKLRQYKQAVADATAKINSQLSGLSDGERSQAIRGIKGKTKVEGQAFEINHSDVVRNIVGGGRTGGLAVIDKIENSVNSMRGFLNDNAVVASTGEVKSNPIKDTAKEQKVTQKTFDFFRKKVDESVSNGFEVDSAVSSVSKAVDGIKGISPEDKQFIKEDISKYVASKSKPVEEPSTKENTKEEIENAPDIVVGDKPKKVKGKKKPTETKTTKEVVKKNKSKPVLSILEENLQTAKVNQEKLESDVDILHSNISTFSDTISVYEKELDNLQSDKKGLNAKITKEKYELKSNKKKLLGAQAHLKNRDIVRNKTKLKIVAARLKATMIKIMGQVARLRNLISKNKENIKGYRQQSLVIERKMEDVVSKIVEFKSARRELATRAKTDKKTLEGVKEVVTESKEELIDAVLDTSETAREKFEVGKGGLDLTDLSDKTRKQVQTLAKQINAVMNDNLKKLDVSQLNEDTESYSRLFVEENTKVVQKRAGKQSEKVLTFNRRVAEMMAIETLVYASEKLNDLTFNDDIQIKKMLGFSDDTRLPQDVRKELQQVGRFHSVEAAGLGKRILKDVGIKQKDEAESQAQVKLESTLGGMAFKAMEDLGLINYSTEFTTDRFREVKEQVVDYNEGNALSIEEEVDTVNNLSDSSLGIPMITTSKELALLAKDKYGEVSEKVEDDLGVEKWVKTARTSKKDYTVHEVRGMEKELQIPEKQDKVLNDMENKEWTIFKDNVNVLKDEWDKYAHTDDASDEDIQASDEQNKLLKVFGWKKPESVHIDTRDGVIAKNNVIKDSLKRMFEFDEKIGDKDFYFNWFFSKSGRFFMDSTEVNPQTDKLHRFLMGHKDGEVTIGSETGRNEFKLAVVQAFDGSKLLGNRGEDRADIIVNGEVVSDLGSIDKQSLEDSLVQFEAIAQAVQEFDGDVLDLIDGSDHPAHALMAIQELKSYDATKPFKTRMSLETDAVTSGFILGLLTNPTMPIKKLKKWLAKGGVWLGGTSANSFGEYNGTRDSDGNKLNLDSYETGAEAVNSLVAPKIVDKATRATDALVGGVTRKFMKAPFMTFIYGSSIDNIKASIGRNVADETMQKLSDPKTVEDTVGLLKDLGLKKEMNLIVKSKGKKLSAKKMAKRFRDLSIVDEHPTRRKVANTIYKTVSNNVENLHGEAVKVYMSEEFKEIVGDKKNKKKGSKQLINSGFSLLFGKFKEQFDARVTPDMTKGQMDAELDKMAEEGLIPGIFTVNSDRTDKKQRTGIVKKRPVTNKEKVQIPFKKSRTLHPLIREMVEAPSSGAVLNIHWLDGGIISEVLGEGNSLGIHDATLQTVGSAVSNAKGYSKATWDMTQGYSVIEELYNELKRAKLKDDKVAVELKKLSALVKSNKKALSKMRVDVEHMSMPGSKFSIQGDNVPDTTVEEVAEDVKLGKPIDITEMSTAEIRGVVAEMSANNGKVTAKKKDGIIKDKITGADIDAIDAIPDEHC